MTVDRNPEMTAQERLLLFSLRAQPGQTLDELATSIGTKPGNYLRRSLQILSLTGKVVINQENGIDTFYPGFVADTQEEN
jgi:hypothetical protein